MSKKCLIAYYSWSGNTKNIAEKISNIIDCDLFEINTIKPYPKDYSTTVEVAKQEKLKDYLPPLSSKIDTAKYDIIFVGTPVWWYTMAPPLKSFLKNSDLSGKIIMPFCTHGGGGASSTFKDIAEILPDATIKEGFVCYGNTGDEKELSDWIKSQEL